MVPPFADSAELRRHMSARQNGRTLLAFSRGKDSLCAWLKLRENFDEIIPVYMYTVPGLEFIDESLAYYEKWFGTRIIRMPHPSLYRQLNNLVFQAPENCAVIERLSLPNFDYADVFRCVREDYNLPLIYHATGVRAKDSPMRWIAMQTHGPIADGEEKFHAIYDYNKAELLDTIRAANIRLPVDYRWFGRTLDGLDYRFLAPLKAHAPRDYARVLEFFPLAELELFRMEHRD